MPFKGGSGNVTSYPALPRRKQQQHFPHVRRTVKAKTAVPKLKKDQSTLTQLDFVNTTPNSSIIIPGSSDDEFEDPRPAKKRRKTKFDDREAGQSSLTQIINLPRSGISRLSSDGFQIWEDDFEDDDIVEELVPKPRIRSPRRRISAGKTRLTFHEDVENEPEIPSTSQQEQVKSSQRIDSGVEAEAVISIPSTPSHARVKGVPSSQTPPSTNYSIRSSHRLRSDQQRSPLKEKSTIVQFVNAAERTPESQVNLKRLQRIREATRKVPLKDAPGRTVIYERKIQVQAEPSLVKSPPKRQSRKFQRTTTVQDSQPDDMGLSLSTVAEEESPAKPSPALQRVTTIPDSQPEESQSLVPLSLPFAATLSSDAGIYQDQQSYGGYTQATYDPVMSALDRDAARFAWTQTQTGTQALALQFHEDSETDDEDLDRGCGSPGYRPDVEHERPQIIAMRKDVMTVVEDSQIVSKPSGPSPVDGHDDPILSDDDVDDDDDDDVPGETTLVAEGVIVISSPSPVAAADGIETNLSLNLPSSPPVLRQISTHNDDIEEIVSLSPTHKQASQHSVIAPAQASIDDDLPAAKEDDEAALANTYASEASTIPPFYPSPDRQKVAFAELPSSSALPLPPWSSSFIAPEADTTPKKALHIQDWSLPPPPPMSSSRSATPASSRKQ